MLLRLVAFTLTAAAAPFVGAGAQDRARAVDIPASAFGPSWTGFYVGAGFGAGALESAVTSTGTVGLTVDRSAGSGILAAVYGGVDYQLLPRALVGILVEGTWSNIGGSASAQAPGVSASLTRKADFGWSALVRAGVLAHPTTLLYLIGGYSGQNLRTDGTALAGGALAGFSRNEYFNGWTIGTGVETRLGGGWSTKLEYRYTQFESKAAPGTSFVVQPTTHTARVGLTYKFGSFGDDAAAGVAGESPARDWTGIYLGAGAGASASINRLDASFGNASSSLDAGGHALLGTVFAGYDFHVAPRLVLGVLGDLTWTGPQSLQTLNAGGGTFTITSRTNMSWDALARVGFLPSPSTLLYAAGGYTGEHVTTTASASVGGFNASATQDDVVNGWTVGPGVETVIFGGWTTRLEYRYSRFERKAVTAGTSVQPSMHTVRAGLAYKFGAGK
ncbi:MAG: porin family protein [Enhydrobacter sp.]|nr:MAG: porin family protein [Enhydrobacter sp.]